MARAIPLAPAAGVLTPSPPSEFARPKLAVPLTRSGRGPVRAVDITTKEEGPGDRGREYHKRKRGATASVGRERYESYEDRALFLWTLVNR